MFVLNFPIKHILCSYYSTKYLLLFFYTLIHPPHHSELIRFIFFFQPDSDLVFDNLEDTHSPHDAISSQPVEETHWLSSTFHRIRRNVGNFLNSFSSTEGRQKSRKHRQTQDGDEYNVSIFQKNSSQTLRINFC